MGTTRVRVTRRPPLAERRHELAGSSGATADDAAKQRAIEAKRGTMPTPGADRTEIHTDRDWRDLVEAQLPARLVAAAAPPITERDDIKGLLGVPT